MNIIIQFMIIYVDKNLFGYPADIMFLPSSTLYSQYYYRLV